MKRYRLALTVLLALLFCMPFFRVRLLLKREKV